MFLVCNSFAKNFGMYGERIGTLSVITNSETESEIVRSKLNHNIRVTYSSPPLNGSRIIDNVLSDRTLFEQWKSDIKGMVSRMKDMRVKLRAELEDSQCTPPAGLDSWAHVTQQTGMFCYTGLTSPQVGRLVNEFDI